TVVVCDLKGYGESRSAPGGPLGEGYGNRERAAELVELMARLGFERFAVVGHDRGGRVAYRMALDHPAAVARRAALSTVPTADRDAGRRIACPVRVHWGAEEDAMADGPLRVWRRWADDVRGGPLPSGHFLAEEAPTELLASLRPFLYA